MAKQVNDNPTKNKSVALTTYTFSATDNAGQLTTSVGVATLERCQSVIITVTGGTEHGFTTTQEYFVIPVDDTHIKLASSIANAAAGVAITTTGNAGAGVLYPSVSIGGVMYVGVTGDLNIKGAGSKTFSLHKNISDGYIIPFMVKEVSTYLTTCTDIVAWMD